MNSRFYSYSLSRSQRYQSDADAAMERLEAAEKLAQQWEEVHNAKSN